MRDTPPADQSTMRSKAAGPWGIRGLWHSLFSPSFVGSERGMPTAQRRHVLFRADEGGTEEDGATAQRACEQAAPAREPASKPSRSGRISPEDRGEASIRDPSPGLLTTQRGGVDRVTHLPAQLLGDRDPLERRGVRAEPE